MQNNTTTKNMNDNRGKDNHYQYNSNIKGRAKENVDVLNYEPFGGGNGNTFEESENTKDREKNLSEYAEEQNRFADKLKLYLNSRCNLRLNSISESIDVKLHSSKDWEALEDRTFNDLLIGAKKAGIKITKDYLHTYLNSSEIDKTNPVKEAIENYSKEFPETEGVIDELTSTVKVDNEKKWPLYFKRWFVGMVANIFEDERCTNHVCLILSGGQGLFKSTFISNLLPKELNPYKYIGKIDAKANNKDTLSLVATKLLLIIDDQLQQINKKDENEIKTLITRDKVTWRRPFATFDITRPHRASFAATVNGLGFLTDPTGSRRWLPFEVISIDIDKANSICKKKVFAEAYQLYLSGFRYWFENSEIDILNIENEKFKAKTKEYELLVRYIDWDKKETEFLTTTDIQTRLTEFSKIANITPKSIGSALKDLDFIRKQKKIGGRPIYGYEISLKGDSKKYDFE